MKDFDARRASLDLVTAFVSNNKLTATELPALLTDVYNAVSTFGNKKPGKEEAKPVVAAAPAASSSPAPATASAKAPDAPKPAVSSTPVVTVEESIKNPNFIISLITGDKLKTLKRHLKFHGLTEDEYRARYNLPLDYPFVAKAYSELRRSVAHKMGLGRKSASPSAKPASPKKAPKKTSSALSATAATPAKDNVKAKQESPAKVKQAPAGKSKPKSNRASAPKPKAAPAKTAASTTAGKSSVSATPVASGAARPNGSATKIESAAKAPSKPKTDGPAPGVGGVARPAAKAVTAKQDKPSPAKKAGESPSATPSANSEAQAETRKRTKLSPIFE